MAGTKTWASGDVLTHTDLNGYLRDQWITICTSGTRPTTTQEGRTIFETDTDRYYRWDSAAWQIVADLGAWISWTPVVTQGATPTLTNSGSTYTKNGRTVTAHCLVNFTGAGTAANDIVSTLPITAAAARGVGSFYFIDAGTGYTGGSCRLESTTTVKFLATATSLFGQSTTIANTDQLSFTITYEAAS